LRKDTQECNTVRPFLDASYSAAVPLLVKDARQRGRHHVAEADHSLIGAVKAIVADKPPPYYKPKLGPGMFEHYPFFRDAKATIWERISSGFTPQLPMVAMRCIISACLYAVTGPRADQGPAFSRHVERRARNDGCPFGRLQKQNDHHEHNGAGRHLLDIPWRDDFGFLIAS
jgi:hypothetical protein